MTQSIFNSVRRLNFYNFKTKYINQNETIGEFFKKRSIEDFGSIPEPSCLDFDIDQSLLAIGSKKGLIKIFGKPGICFSTRLKDQDEIWNIKFIPGTNYVITLTSENKLILWLISCSTMELLKIDTISNLNFLCSDRPSNLNKSDYNNNTENSIQQNITVVEVIEMTSSIIMGNGEGSLIQVKLDLMKIRKQSDIQNNKWMTSGNGIWQIPTKSDVIDKNRLISKLPVGSQSRVLLNAVIHVSGRPGSRKHLLIGYNSGYSIIYNLQKDTVDYILSSQVPLNGLSWCPPDPIIQDSFLVSPDATKPQYQLSSSIYSCHEDGSIIKWTLPLNSDAILANSSNPIFPLGNNQKCLSISKILWKRYKQEYLVIFAGGLPRSEYLTKSTISIMNSNCLDDPSIIPDHKNNKMQQIILDLTSQLIDFTTIDDIHNECVQYLLVLAEEEFFIVDLTKDDWPILHEQQPYLNCLHQSPISAYHFISDVKQDWFDQLCTINNQKFFSKLVFNDWPITGGFQKATSDEGGNDIWQNDLLIVGHGDGTVAFWRLGLGGCLRKITTVKSSYLFTMNDESHQNYRDYEDESIPFRRTGLFDPCCDDIRLAIQLIHYTGNYLLIGGYGGQVILWGYADKPYKRRVVEVDLTTHLSNFKWKGCQPFQCDENNNIQRHSTFQPLMILLIFPPSQITALDILEVDNPDDSLLIACGTLHGLVMVACPKQGNSDAVILTSHCTIPRNSQASQEAALGEGWARRRTRELKKSLRSSFRRLRRRSTKRMEHPSVSRHVSNPENKSIKVELVENEIEFQERAIEDRPKDTVNDGLIRSIKIYISFIKKKAPTGTIERQLNLFVGCYGGQMMWFQSDNSVENIFTDCSVNIRLIKQYQFQHRAPILYFNVIKPDANHTGMPILNENGFNDNESQLSRKIDHIVVITEEQIRLYAFPSFTLKHKTRVTANDGFKLKCGHIMILNDDRGTGHNNKESIICATNNGGQFLLLNSSNLKRKDVVQFVDKTDLMALSFMSFATSFSSTNSAINLPYGICYSGQGQVNLFEIISKSKKLGIYSNGYNSRKASVP